MFSPPIAPPQPVAIDSVVGKGTTVTIFLPTPYHSCDFQPACGRLMTADACGVGDLNRELLTAVPVLDAPRVRWSESSVAVERH